MVERLADRAGSAPVPAAGVADQEEQRHGRFARTGHHHSSPGSAAASTS